MADGEAAQARLARRLEEVLGAEEARTLMELVSPQRWDELATRDDLTLLGDELRGEMAELRDALRGEMAGLRGEMGELRGEMGELRGEMGELDEQLRGEMDRQHRQLKSELMADLRAEINDTVLRQGRTMMLSMVGTVVAMGGIALGVAAM